MTSFVKMHGLGNDFVIIDQRKKTGTSHLLSKAQVSAIADRRRGVGCDQLVFIYPANSCRASASLKFLNADGSESSACGNATRCVAWYLMSQSNESKINLETDSGILHAFIKKENIITIDMGLPKLKWVDIPLSKYCDTLYLPIQEEGLSNPVGVSMGNPHCIFFVENVEEIDLTECGAKIENHSLFPERTNVGFASKLGPNIFRLRVWERGTGITQSCGTGACATAVACHRRGLSSRRVEIVTDGGHLNIHWRKKDGHVLMTGPAETSFTGELLL